MERINMRAPQRRYSETLRVVAPILMQHKHGKEILRTAVFYERANGPESGYDIAEALYWIGANYHGGQSCPFYAMMGATLYTPGMLANGPEEGSMAEMIYDDMVEIISGR